MKNKLITLLHISFLFTSFIHASEVELAVSNATGQPLLVSANSNPLTIEDNSWQDFLAKPKTPVVFYLRTGKDDLRYLYTYEPSGENPYVGFYFYQSEPDNPIKEAYNKPFYISAPAILTVKPSIREKKANN